MLEGESGVRGRIEELPSEEEAGELLAEGVEGMAMGEVRAIWVWGGYKRVFLVRLGDTQERLERAFRKKT